MNRTILAASISGIIVMTFGYPAVNASPRATDSLLLQTQGGTIEQSAARGGRGGGHSANRSASRNVNRNVNRNTANRNVNRNANRNVNRTTVNRNVNRNVNRAAVTRSTVGQGGRAWVRPANYWWRPGGAVAAGAAIGFVSAATAAAWAGSAPAAGYCWYYTDSSQRQGFWDQCP